MYVEEGCTLLLGRTGLQEELNMFGKEEERDRYGVGNYLYYADLYTLFQ